MGQVIDAHAHLWRADDGFHDWLGTPGLERLNRTFTADELSSRTSLAGVDGVVLVEGGTPAGQDTWELLGQTQMSSRLVGVVPWVDLHSPEIDKRIEKLRDAPSGRRIVGFRTQVQSEDDMYLERADVRAGISAIGRAGLPFELVLRPAQRDGALDLLDALEDMRFVIDHLGGPDFESGRPTKDWIRWMGELGKRSNADVKLSALHSGGTTATGAGREELVGVSLETMGPSRLAWGSDWPMSLLHRTYAQTLTSARSLLVTLSDVERAMIFGMTAERMYGLGAT